MAPQPTMIELATAEALPRRRPAWRDVLPVALFMLAHVPLAYAIRAHSIVGTVHAALVVFVGLLIVTSPRWHQRAAFVCAYIAGCEVLWRMGHASIFWETGKYATSLLLLLAIVRSGRARGSVLPLIYIALLVPATVMVIATHPLSEARDAVSFNISGPVSLTISVWFFSRLELKLEELQAVWLATLGPIVGIGFLALFGISSAQDVRFAHSASSALASGGFGPNQVSAILGLGALLALLYALTSPKNRVIRFLMFAVMVWLMCQSALTMSRGGLYTLVLAAIPAIFFAVRDRRLRARLVAVIVPTYVIVAFIVIPQLDQFTGGALTRRFTDTSTTGRIQIVEGDLQLFSQHPVWGVGIGESPKLRSTHAGIAAHTEYSRLLADHGIFGLAAILMLFTMAAVAVWKARSDEGKAIASASAVWALVFMTHAAMRLVAPSFMFGLSMARLRLDTEGGGPERPLAGAEVWPR